MIPETEVHELVQSLGVPLAHVEKDYVMGWLLSAIYTESPLADSLVLKGGNCLRKAYFSDTRFSDDLDFTALRMPTEQEFGEEMVRLCRLLSTRAEIPFEFERFRVEEKPTPVDELRAIDGRVYFRGFAGDASVVMRLKFDVSDYEKIVFPTVRRPLIHDYSDSSECTAELVTYAVEEVLAEKLRSWIQRTRARDLFDAVKIIQAHSESLDKARILRAFLSKTIFKDLPQTGRDELLVKEKFEIAEEHWPSTIVCPKNALLVVKKAIQIFRDYVIGLFSSQSGGGAGRGWRAGPVAFGVGGIASALRERIIAAGRVRETIWLTYRGKRREVEPYSFRYRVRKSDGVGEEYFYGFDRTRGQTIKSFITSRIQGVERSGRTFTPRFVVEF